MADTVKEILDSMQRDLQKAESIAEDLLDNNPFQVMGELRTLSDNWRMYYSALRIMFKRCNNKELASALILLFKSHPPRCSDVLLSFLKAEKDRMINRLNLKEH